VFTVTARYGLSAYVTEIRFVLKGLMCVVCCVNVCECVYVSVHVCESVFM
jgi:hypothetical protein